jgi:hypothetical protein
MASWVVAEVLKEARERSIAASQGARPEMNGVDDRKVLVHHLHFELSDRFQKGRRRYLIAIRSARRDNRKHACLPGFRQPEWRHGAEPPAVDRPALIKDVRSVNSDTIFDRLPLRVTTLEIIKHRMVRPLDSVMRIVPVESDIVQRLDVLHVGSVATQYPGIGRRDFRQRRGVHRKFGIGIGKIRDRKPRLLTVISEDDAVALAGRKCKQACTRRRGIANLGTLADAVCIIFPMMKRAADRFTLDIANREVCPEVRAVRAHHVRDSGRPPDRRPLARRGNRPLQFRPREFRATDK